MNKTIFEGNIKSKELIAFTAIILLMIGTIYFYDNSSPDTTNIPGNNIIWVDFIDEGKMNIWSRSTDDIYGIQFEFDGLKLNNFDGGYLKDNGFDTSHNEKMILSFSFQGKFVPQGEYLLLKINTDLLVDKQNVNMASLVIAGKGGKSLDFGYYDIFKRRVTTKTNQ